MVSGRDERRLNDYRDAVAHFGSGPADVATLDSFFGQIGGADGFYIPVTLSGALFSDLQAAGVTGVSVPESECWFSARGETPLEPAARSIGAPAVARRFAVREARTEEGRAEVRRLKKLPWDHHADGHVYFKLSTPRFVVADPMLLAGGGRAYRVKQFVPGIYRLPVAAIKGVSGRGPGVDVDSASLVFVDERFFDSFTQTFDWETSGRGSGSRHLAYLQQVAEQIGSRFGYCSAAVATKWPSDFGGDGRYEIDPSAVEPAEAKRVVLRRRANAPGARPGRRSFRSTRRVNC